MALNKSKGNMYDFITHTWNPIKGTCCHDCSYCYMKGIRKRYNQKEKAPYLDEKELTTSLGSGNFIFIGSSTDIFARDIPSDWDLRILDYAKLFDNKYLFQTKNTLRAVSVIGKLNFPLNSVLCTTLETNRHYPDLYKKCPPPEQRADYLKVWTGDRHVTIEPVVDFDLLPFIKMIRGCNPSQVNIGADSGDNHLPEPPKEKILELISELEKFTKVYQKDNLKRIIGKQQTMFDAMNESINKQMAGKKQGILLFLLQILSTTKFLCMPGLKGMAAKTQFQFLPTNKKASRTAK